MSIQTKRYTSKRTGKETTRYYAVVRDSIRGQTVWSKGFDLKSDAKMEEARMLLKIARDELVINKFYFEDVGHLWLEFAKDRYANSTYRGYEGYYFSYILPLFIGKEVDKILPINIQNFVTAMSKKYAAETVNKCISILSNIFQFANKMLHATHLNPTRDVKRLKVSLKDGVTWKPKQINNFLSYQTVKESHVYELLITSFLLGARPSEVCGLARESLKPSRELVVERGYDRYGVKTNLKTERSHRVLMISEWHYELLINRIAKQDLQAKEAKAQDAEYDDNDFLFKQADGKPYNPSSYSRIFRQLLKEYNDNHKEKLPRLSLYDARHSFATNLVSQDNVGLSVVAAILGNSEKTCDERYVHHYKESKELVVVSYEKSIRNSKSKEDDSLKR